MSDRRGTSTNTSGELPDMFEARLTAGPDALEEFFKRFQVDVGCRHPHATRNDDGSITVLVYAPDQQIKEIERAGYSVKRGENVSAIGRERQAEVGKGDRFEGGRSHPDGLGSLDKGRPGRTAS